MTTLVDMFNQLQEVRFNHNTGAMKHSRRWDGWTGE